MKKILFIFLIVVSFMFTNVYASDVKIKEVKLDSKTGDTYIVNEPTFNGLEINSNVKFSEVNDYVKYMINIENNDDVDYELDFSNSIPDNEYIKYEISNDTNNIIKKNSNTIFYLTITYSKKVSDKDFTDNKFSLNDSINLVVKDNEKVINPNTGLSMVFTIILLIFSIALFVILYRYKNIKFIVPVIILCLFSSVYAIEKFQIVINSNVVIERNNSVLNDTNSNGVADVGEMISIGSENFYVISNDGTNVKALAEWNLLVGNQYDGTNTIALTNPTGLQDSSAIGYKSSGYPYIGTVAFSSSKYWTGTDGETIDLTNSANNIYTYLTEYKTSLINLGGKISDISLITKTELIALGCSEDDLSCDYTPNWVYQTSYWTCSAFNDNLVWRVSNNGNLFNIDYTNNHIHGVRPVINVLVNDLK